MNSLFLIAVCLALGVLTRRTLNPPPGLAQGLNWWVLNVALSALVLHLIPQLEFHWDLWFLIVSMWVVFFGAWGMMALIGAKAKWSRGRVGALTLVCGLGNTSFIGFPLIEALRGPEAVQLAVVADQAGCFVALAIGGTLVAALYSGRTVSARSIVRRVLAFPPFISLWIGAFVGALGAWPSVIDEVLLRLSATLVPLALFSVGLQLQLRPGAQQLGAMSAALSWKLVLAPAVVWVLSLLFAVDGEVRAIAVLEAAMAPMISGAILAEQHGLEPSLANMVLGMGILISLVSVPLVNMLLLTFG